MDNYNRPAFPVYNPNDSRDGEVIYGMTKLEYAVIEAMKAILAGCCADHTFKEWPDPDKVAKKAVEYAQALTQIDF